MFKIETENISAACVCVCDSSVKWISSSHIAQHEKKNLKQDIKSAREQVYLKNLSSW